MTMQNVSNASELPVPAPQPASLATLPALAAYLRNAMPEFGGRVLAVSESMMTKENVPTLPLVMLALVKEEAASEVRTNVSNVTERFIVEVWIAPERYKTSAGKESPFWGFYDYDTLRDRVVSFTNRWKSPRGYKIAYAGLDHTSTDFAVVVCLTFTHEFRYCPPDLPLDEFDGREIDKDTFDTSLVPTGTETCADRCDPCDDLDSEKGCTS
jgi:hypothetical protein